MEVDLFSLPSDSLRTVTSKLQTPSTFNNNNNKQHLYNRKLGRLCFEGQMEMTQHSEQGWEEVQGIQEESN